MATKLDKLLAKAKEAPANVPKWAPAEGDSLCGEVVRERWLPGSQKDDDGKTLRYLSIVVKTPEHGDVLYNLGTMAQEAYEELGVKVGWTVAFVFHGTEKVGRGTLHIVTLAAEAP